MSATAVTPQLIRDWFGAATVKLDEAMPLLTKLDAVRGDADHGVNMKKGFDAIMASVKKTPPQASAKELLSTASTAMRRSVGGTSGALWSLALLKASRDLPSDGTVDGTGLLRSLRAAAQAVHEAGGAVVGDGTMLDALVPGLDAMETALGEGATFADALQQCATASTDGATTTAHSVATKGRASYLGERGLGSPDPGAVSASIILQALADAALALSTEPNQDQIVEEGLQMRIGFIGLGTMGAGMAGNLVRAGYIVFVHDVFPASADPLVAQGAIWSASPQELSREAEVIFTSLPGPREVEEVAAGILSGAKPGSIYVDLSTSSPTLIRRLYDQFAAAGISVLDAPVSGGVQGSRDGTLAVWAGGDEDAWQRVEPVIRAFSKSPYYCGPVGSGSVVKLVHNIGFYGVGAAVAEAFSLGVKAGVAPESLLSALSEGRGGAHFSLLSERVLDGAFDPAGFALRLALKDTRLALELADHFDVPMPIGRTVETDMEEADMRGLGGKDRQISMALQGERAGVNLTGADQPLFIPANS